MFKQSLTYLTATAFIVAVNFLTLPFFTKFLTLSDYGVLALFILFGTISTGLLSFGLSLAMYRFYFKYKIGEFKILNSTIIFTLFVFFTLSGIFIVYPYADWISLVIFSKSISGDLLQLSFLNGCIQYFYLYFSELLAARKKAKVVSFLLVMQAANVALLTLYFIVWESLTSTALIYALCISNFISLLLAFAMNIKLITFSFQLEKLITAIKFSYPETPGILMGILHSSFDKTMLANNRGPESVGYYEFGTKFSIILKHFMDAISRSWIPFFMENAQKNTQINNEIITKRFYELAFLFGAVGLTVSLFSEEALIVLTTEGFYRAKYLIPLLIISVLFGTLGFLSVNQIMYAEKLIYNLPVSVLSLVVNLVLNIILIPKYGALGAVIATAITSIIASIVLLYLANKAYRLLHSYRRLILYMLLVIILSLLSYPVIAADISLLYKIIMKVLLIVAYIFFAIRIGLIDTKLFNDVISYYK